MRKLCYAGLVALVIVLVAGAAWVVINQDRESPVISIDDSKLLSWHSDMDKSELLRGVTARDDIDGDVTDSLMIESVKLDVENRDKATVTYVAKDSSQNITKAIRIIDYAGDDMEKDAADVTNTDENLESGAAGDDKQKSSEAEQASSEESPEDMETKAVEAREVAIAELPEAYPRFYLKQHYVSVNVGESFDKLSWVDEITDSKDSRYYLFQYISVEGDVNIWTSGVYELKYYAVDSDGNRSNEEILSVTVN